MINYLLKTIDYLSQKFKQYFQYYSKKRDDYTIINFETTEEEN